MIGPFRLVVVATLLLCSLAGSVMASIKANCTVDYSSMIIDCATDFSKVVTTMECSITSYIRYEVPHTTSRDGHMSIAIPSGVYINEVHVTVNRSNCVTKEIPVNLTSQNTSRLVNARCEVDQGLKEDPDCNSGVTNQQCIAQKCLITYEVKSTMDTNRTIYMKIPDDVDIHKYNVTPILMSGWGKVEVSVTAIRNERAYKPDSASTIPQGTVVFVVGSIAVAIIGLIAGVHVLKRRRDERTRDQQTANTQEEDLNELEMQALSTSSDETSA